MINEELTQKECNLAVRIEHHARVRFGSRASFGRGGQSQSVLLVENILQRDLNFVLRKREIQRRKI
ncbi:MAG: hypothetical protein FWD19_02165, partial [Defluviitaleaceae bacterium]|nr:hypothetical protein [Defluviitaleaceae bacterium]